jgi:hypothetical protein
MIKTQPGQSRARTPTVEIAIRGEGALVIRFIDKSGQTLLQERLTVSGSPKIEARRIVELSLETTTGRALVAPVLVQQSNAKQRVTFDGETPARFARRRCQAIGCEARIARSAAAGEAPLPIPAPGPRQASDDRGLDRVIKSLRRRK